MTALRQLSGIYLAAAGAYTIALALSAHPDWSRKSEETASYLRIRGTAAAVAVNDQVLRPGAVMAEVTGRAVASKIVTAFEAPPTRVAQKPPVRIANAQPAPHRAAAPKTPSVVATLPPVFLRGSEAARPENEGVTLPVPQRPFALAPQATTPPNRTASLPPSPAANPGDIIRVEQRLKENLTSEMLANFELFLYVSKADTGPWAQHMYVFQKQASGDLVLLYNWPVSTGREQIEFNPAGKRLTTYTPGGYYELDPNRSYVHYRSMEWGQPMPYAMFFNWVREGNQTGLAIHAATGDDVGRLGQRASAGCIHLSEDNARILFTMIRSQYKGLAPRFAFDRRTGTMSNDGILLHDAGGNVKMADGYKVLVFIEDFGGENVVAALF
jgi:lipoprotein-anchoring transpeptidase ErfK/SrfK